MLVAQSFLNWSTEDLNESENRAMKAKKERSTLQVELARVNGRLFGLREENLMLTVESLKCQEVEITVKVKAAMANNFLLNKFKNKEQMLLTLVDDYLLIGNIKDLESEDEKDDGVDATASTADSDPHVVPLNILPLVSQGDNIDDVAGQ